jgi:hypothetical protein
MTDASIRGRLETYAAAEDPLTGASNRLALIVASNQPFYPLYVWWVTGEATPLLALTFLSTPFFVATPAVSRRFPQLGRLWLPAIGALNTFFCAYVFGEASGVELFLAPCLIIAMLSCRASQRRALALYLAGVFGGFALLHGRYAAPLYRSGQAQYEALLTLNAYSAAILSIIAAWMLYRARSESQAVGR